jgi:D-proline reductase (dithiol) PrdB
MCDPERDLNLHGKAWLALGIGPQRDAPPFHRSDKPLAQMRLALVTTGGIVPPGGAPFHTGKRGDPSFREVDRDVDPDRLVIHHPHYDHTPVKRDMNVLFPVPLCRQLVSEKKLGGLAETNYSFMGYVPLTRKLERQYAPQLARRLKQQQVDAVLLTPA